MEIKLKTLQERVSSGLSQSENASFQSKDSQNELKKYFDEEVYKTIKRYSKKVNILKKKVNKLTNLRFKQIKDFKERIKTLSNNLEETKHTNMMSWVSADPPKRISLRPEIYRLKEKCTELENKIRKLEIEKGIVKEEKKTNDEEIIETDKGVDVKVYYKLMDDCSVKLALVFPNGNVIISKK